MDESLAARQDEDFQKLLTNEQAAERLGIQPGTLENWRVRKFGPPYIKMGKVVRYEINEVDRYKRENKIFPRGEK